MDLRDFVVLSSILLIAISLIYQEYLFRRRPPPLSLKGRRDLSYEEILQKYYSDSSITSGVFRVLWDDIADAFLVRPGLIRPDDTFGGELPYKGIVPDEDMFLSGALYRRMRELGIEEPIPEMKRVDDYIRFLTGS